MRLIFDFLLLPKDYLNEAKIISEVIHPFTFTLSPLEIEDKESTCTPLPLRLRFPYPEGVKATHVPLSPIPLCTEGARGTKIEDKITPFAIGDHPFG